MPVAIPKVEPGDRTKVIAKLRETSERQKRIFDIKRRDNQRFKVGDFVLLSLGQRPEKFSCEFVGPYRIKLQATGDRYLLQKVGAQKILMCSKDQLRLWPTDWTPGDFILLLESDTRKLYFSCMIFVLSLPFRYL